MSERRIQDTLRRNVAKALIVTTGALGLASCGAEKPDTTISESRTPISAPSKQHHRNYVTFGKAFEGANVQASAKHFGLIGNHYVDLAYPAPNPKKRPFTHTTSHVEVSCDLNNGQTEVIFEADVVYGNGLTHLQPVIQKGKQRQSCESLMSNVDVSQAESYVSSALVRRGEGGFPDSEHLDHYSAASHHLLSDAQNAKSLTR